MVMFAEVRQNGEWHKVGKEFVSTYEEMEGQLTDRVFDGRNMELTAFLASYYYGNIISEPDVGASEECKNHKLLSGQIVYVSTLREILDFDWDKEVYELGYISEWQYKRLKNDGIEPTSIIKNPFRGGGNMAVRPFFMDMVIARPSLRQQCRYFVEYRYDKCKMRDVCDFFCNVSVPRLIELIPDGGTIEDVRIIFSV